MKELIAQSGYVAVRPLQDEKKKGSILLPGGDDKFALGEVVSCGGDFKVGSSVMYARSAGGHTLLLGEAVMILKREDVIGEVIEV